MSDTTSTQPGGSPERIERSADSARAAAPGLAFARANVGRLVAAASFVAMICITAVTAVRIQVAAYTPFPFWDFWDGLIPAYKASIGGLTLNDFTFQHNEHRALVGRVQILADYSLFGGRLVSLLAVIFVSLVLLAAVLTWPFATVSRDRTVTLGFFAFALAATLTPAGWENLTMPIQVCQAQVYLFAVLAIALAAIPLPTADAARDGRSRALVLTAIVVSAGLSTYSMANGLVVWPILVALLLVRRAGRWPVVVVAVAGALSTASYLRGYHPVTTHSTYAESLKHPLAMVRYILTFLGQPMQFLGAGVTYAFGALGVAASVVLVVVAVRDGARHDRRATVFGAATAAFVLATAAQTALGRLEFGFGQALSSRYSIAAAVFWVGLAAGVAPLLVERVTMSVRAGERSFDATPLAFVVTCLLVFFVAGRMRAPSEGLLTLIRTHPDPVLVASVAGVHDETALRVIHPVPRLVASRLRWLQTARKGPWSNGAADALVSAERRVPEVAGLRRCHGYVDTATGVGRGKRYDGWIEGPRRRASARELDVVDATGASDGVGIVGFYRRDVKQKGASTSATTGFVAYARTSAGPATHIVLFDQTGAAPLCALPIPPNLNPRA